LHEFIIPFEMGTSMIGRVAALLNQDLSRSLVIFLALARGQELIVFILITGSMIVYGLRSRGCLVHEMGKGIKD
jgi:ABC-type transport system involved in cytochrome c biogenesis permease component